MSLGTFHSVWRTLGLWSRGLAASALLATGLAAAEPTNYGDPGAQELALKARFTIELAMSIKFPMAKVPSVPFTIAVVGESPFHDELEVYAKGRLIQGRAIRIIKSSRLPEAQACDLLFICRSEKPRVRAIVAWARYQGILTVAEGEDMARLGVMVNLMVEDTLKVGLNRRALEEEGFTIGAQILQVARILVPSKSSS